MSEVSGTHTSAPVPASAGAETSTGTGTAAAAAAAAAPEQLTNTGQRQQPDGGERPETVSRSPRTTGFLPQLGWLGLVLLLVGLIAMGMAIGNNQNIGVDDELTVSGNLGPVAGLAASEKIGPNAVIGEVVLPATVAAFAAPNGESIARVDAGTYGMLDSEPGWARVVLLGPSSDGFYITGWVQINEETTLTIG